MRYAGLAAKARMIRWARKLIRELRDMGIEVIMILIFVDDVRIICRAIKRGWSSVPNVKNCTGAQGTQAPQMKQEQPELLDCWPR